MVHSNKKHVGLNKNSKQGDRLFLDFMEKMGCKVTSTEDVIELKRDPKTQLKGINVNMSNTPDVVQTLAVVACFASSSTTIRNIGHLKLKETDRIASTANELRKIGAEVTTTDDSMTISPKKSSPAVIETYDDHRMAMSFSIAGLKIPGIVIKNPSCVTKSFPEFYDVLKELYK